MQKTINKLKDFIYYAMYKKLLTLFNNIFNSILDIVMPGLCINCKAEVSGPSLLCVRCRESIIIRKAPRRIGSRLLFAAADYRDPAIRNLVKIMKYERVWKAGKPIADIMLQHLEIAGLKKVLPEKNKIFIVPIPIHFLKKWFRGFNQSEILADIIGCALQIQVTPALNRQKWTLPQNTITDNKIRSLNIQSCFTLSQNAKNIPPKSVIILLDDIVTSGETMKEAAQTLKPLRPLKIIFISAVSS